MTPAPDHSRAHLQQRLLARFPWLAWVKPPTPALHTGKLFAKVLATYDPRSHRVLDLGCGPRRIDGAVRCDLALDAPGIRADAVHLPFRSEAFDCVIATAVLEHVPYPGRVVREMRRVLRPGGVAYIEIPFLEGFHADPDDFQRLTFRGLDVLLRRFEILEREVCVGPSSALNWVLREYPATWFRNARVALLMKFVASWLTSPLKYLDYVTASRPGAFRIAAGLAVLARRPGPAFGEPVPATSL